MYALDAYPVKTSMVKYHLEGSLEGTKTTETMGFMTWEEACDWAGAVTMKIGVPYVVLEMVNLATGEKEHF